MSLPTISSVRGDGQLICEEDHTYWCEHIEQLVRSGGDVELIWGEYPARQLVEVPVMPTANLWAPCHLTPNENQQIKSYRVGFETDPAVETEFIGFIHPSEGRAVLREMILDWFIGTKEPYVGRCPARGHGFKETVRWNSDMENRVTAVPQYWSVWATQKCLGCTFDMAGNADLVPDAPASNNVWNR
jgi:hypothetical protein